MKRGNVEPLTLPRQLPEVASARTTARRDDFGKKGFALWFMRGLKFKW